MSENEPIHFGFWKKAKEAAAREKRPIFVMAPLADVTDAAFRRIIAKYSRMGQPQGGPDVLWTEFVSADGLCSAGRKALLRDLEFTEGERPIVAQLFTSKPDKMREAAALVASLGFDGLDINMGCPDRTIEKQGAGAAMMKDPENAVAVIRAAREGVIGASAPIPVSVKTRIGFHQIDLGWIRALLEQKLPVLTVHLRTRKEMSDVPAHWELMPEILKIRDEVSPETIVIGNGDAASLSDGEKKARESGCDGIMFGRAIFGNPWLFDRNKELENRDEDAPRRQEAFAERDYSGVERGKELPAGGKGRTEGDQKEIAERLRVMVEHTRLFEELLGDIKNFAIMKKHYKAYVSGWDGAKELRIKLMEAKDAAEVEAVVEGYLANSLR